MLTLILDHDLRYRFVSPGAVDAYFDHQDPTGLRPSEVYPAEGENYERFSRRVLESGFPLFSPPIYPHRKSDTDVIWERWSVTPLRWRRVERPAGICVLKEVVIPACEVHIVRPPEDWVPLSAMDEPYEYELLRIDSAYHDVKLAAHRVAVYNRSRAGERWAILALNPFVEQPHTFDAVPDAVSQSHGQSPVPA